MQQPLPEQAKNKLFFAIGGNSSTNTSFQRFPSLLYIQITCGAVQVWGLNQASAVFEDTT